VTICFRARRTAGPGSAWIKPLSPRNACKTIVGLLELAGNYSVEAELAQRLDVLLELGELPDLEALFAEFAPRQAECPIVLVEMPDASIYDALLDEEVLA